jgi:hypothetical protein
MTQPFVLSDSRPSSAAPQSIALPAVSVADERYTVTLRPEGAVFTVGRWVARITASGELEAEQRRVSAGYEKLAQQSADEREFEDVRRARRDRNRALRLI